MSAEQAAYQAVHTLLAADSTLTGYIGGAQSIARVDGIDRSNTAGVFIATQVQRETTTAWRATLRVRAVMQEGLAFGTGNSPQNAGTLDALVDRIILALDDVKPVLSGWAFTPADVDDIGASAAGQGLRARDLTVTFLVAKSPATVPLTGSDADLTGVDGEVQSWQITPYAINATTDMTGRSRVKPEWFFGDVTARGSIDVLCKAKSEFPIVKSVITAVFKPDKSAGSGEWFTTDITVIGYEFGASRIGNAPQVTRINFVVNDEDSDFVRDATDA